MIKNLLINLILKFIPIPNQPIFHQKLILRFLFEDKSEKSGKNALNHGTNHSMIKITNKFGNAIGKRT